MPLGRRKNREGFLSNMALMVLRPAGRSRSSDGIIPARESRMLKPPAIDQYGVSPMAFHDFYHFTRGTSSTGI